MQRKTLRQYRPSYDYGKRAPFWDTRHMAGYYTRLGGVGELLGEIDDALVTLGAGDEVHLAFRSLDQAPAAGWSRRLVLETNGWTKDMDLFTRDGETLAPLPARGKSLAHRDRLHAQYNTRYQAGR